MIWTFVYQSVSVQGAVHYCVGGSAPELFISIIGVFVTKSDVGIGTIVGSAVFNVLFVIAACAFASAKVKTGWKPVENRTYLLQVKQLAVILH